MTGQHMTLRVPAVMRQKRWVALAVELDKAARAIDAGLGIGEHTGSGRHSALLVEHAIDPVFGKLHDADSFSGVSYQAPS